MACDRTRARLPLLADGELAWPRRILLERHVAHCPDCTARLEQLQSMSSVMRTKLPFHRAPPGLAARIGAALPREAPPPVSRPWFRMSVFGPAGGGLVGALAGVALTVIVMHGQRADNQLTEDLIGSHVRSLMEGHLMDVQTSDQHTVKPWLSARLDVSPPVKDLIDQGFPLLGGRLDYVDGHKGAAVVYRHAKHIINMFAWAEAGADRKFSEESRQGFNIVTWRRDGIVYYAVSDLEMDQLELFARLIDGA